MMHGFGYGGGYDGGGAWLLLGLIGLVKILFIVAVVMLVVMLVRRSRMMHGEGPMMHHMHGHGPMGMGMTDAPGAPAADEAIAIARKRFASGEITQEQFDAMMGKLTG